MATVSVSDPVLTITDDHVAAVERVIAVMRAQPDVPFTLDQFADIASFSPFHFARLFRQVIGIPPGEFHTALRYERAKELLITTDLSITDVCFEVGYDSLGTFSTRFKQLVGIGPATFRALPDVLATLDAADRRPVKHAPAVAGASATVDGYFVNPDELIGQWRAYVGIFPASIARSRPVAGIRIAPQEAFSIAPAPAGTYRLLSAIVPVHGNAIDRLLPATTMRVASSDGPVSVGPGQVTGPVPLTIRPATSHDAPVLIALPALDFPTVNVASSIVRDAFAHLSPAVGQDRARELVAR
ncbi:MAG: helix-turn-helix transcriptional regulator [Thermomicrobiales bacterium]